MAFERNDPTSGLDVTRGRARATGETPDERVIRLKQLDLADLEQWRVSIDASPASVAQTLGVLLLPAEAGARPSRQSNRNAAIQTKYAELAALGRRNFVKEIKRTVIGADSLSDRRIRDIAKGR